MKSDKVKEMIMHIIRSRIGSLVAMSMLFTIFGCRQSTADSSLAKLAAKVVDENNAPVRGGAADLYRVTPTGKLYWRASSTSIDGIAVFGAKDGGVIPGDYVIHVSFIDFRDLAAGETNDRPVRVKEGDDTVVTFRTVTRRPRRL
jgi:hypothetical protein